MIPFILHKSQISTRYTRIQLYAKLCKNIYLLRIVPKTLLVDYLSICPMTIIWFLLALYFRKRDIKKRRWGLFWSHHRRLNLNQARCLSLYSISHPQQSSVHTGIPKRTSTKGQLSHFNSTFLLTLHIASTHIKESLAHMPYARHALLAESGVLGGTHRCAFISTLPVCTSPKGSVGLPLSCYSVC